MFVVFGASGNTGSVVAATLLAQGKKVRVVARNASKVDKLRAAGAEVFAGDVLDEASVTAALAGAEGAYLLNPPDATSKAFIARSRRVVDAYAAALAKHSIPHAVFLSSVAAQLPSGTGPILTAHYAEEVLPKANAKTSLTFVRAAYFMENLLGFAHPMKQDGVLPVFGGGETYPFPMVATRDIGATAAGALLAAPTSSQWIELSGPREYSFVDAAAEATAIVGKPVKAVPLPIDGLVPALVAVGFSEEMATLYREMNEAFGKGAGFEGKGKSVRGTTVLADVLRPALT